MRRDRKEKGGRGWGEEKSILTRIHQDHYCSGSRQERIRLTLTAEDEMDVLLGFQHSMSRHNRLPNLQLLSVSHTETVEFNILVTKIGWLTFACG